MKKKFAGRHEELMSDAWLTAVRRGVPNGAPADIAISEELHGKLVTRRRREWRANRGQL